MALDIKCAILCLQFGFFKRKTKEELEDMKRTSLMANPEENAQELKVSFR